MWLPSAVGSALQTCLLKQPCFICLSLNTNEQTDKQLMKCLQQFRVKLVSSLVRFCVKFFEMNSFESLSPALASRKWWEGGLSQSFCDSRRGDQFHGLVLGSVSCSFR